MTHHRMHYRGHDRGPGRGGSCGPRLGRRIGNRDEWLERLEEYQRDLEQETADVADLIRRLREAPAESQTAAA